MYDIKIFENPEFGNVRVTTDADGNFLFCLADVCGALGLSNTNQVKKRLREKGISLNDTLTDGGVQQLTYVDESNLYRCIFQCRKKKNALRFQDWIFEDVLPTIRKTGSYSVSSKKVPTSFREALLLAAAQQEEIEKQHAEIEMLSDRIDTMQPKADYCDLILRSPSPIMVSQLAADYGMSPQEFNKSLNALGIQYKVNKQWVLYNQYKGLGYTDSIENIDREDMHGSWKINDSAEPKKANMGMDASSTEYALSKLLYIQKELDITPYYE